MKFTDLYSPALGFDSVWIATVFHFLLMILFLLSCLKATRTKACCAGDYTKRKSGWQWKDAYTKKVSRRGAEDRDAKGERKVTITAENPLNVQRPLWWLPHLLPPADVTRWLIFMTKSQPNKTQQLHCTLIGNGDKKGFPQAWKWLPHAVICLRKSRSNSFLMGYNVIGTANSECSKLNK